MSDAVTKATDQMEADAATYAAAADGDTEGLIQESQDINAIVGSAEKVEALKVYLESELKDVWMGEDRAKRLKRVETWRSQRRCYPLQESKSTPFEGAANMATPMTMHNTNSVAAKLKSMIQSRDPRYQATARQEAYSKHAEALEDFINFFNMSPLHVDIETLDHDVTYETSSLGNCFVDVPWVEDVRNFKRRDPNGGYVTAAKTVFVGPRPQPSEYEYFLTRPEWKDVQTAPWVGFAQYMMDYDLKNWETRGFFTNIEKVLSTPATDYLSSISKEMKGRGVTNALGNTENDAYLLMKCYVQWDVDDDGLVEDLIVWYSYDSNEIIRVEYNQLGVRPIVPYAYFRVPGSLFAMGVGEMSEYPQREADSAHNMRLDGAKLHTLQTLAIDPSAGIKNNEKFFPGKIMKIPPDKIKAITFPDNSQAMAQVEDRAAMYADRAAGIPDLMKGMPDSVGKSGSRLGSQVLQLQRGDSIFDSISTDFRKNYAQMALYQVMQCVANGERSSVALTPLGKNDEQRALLDEIWAMNVEDIPSRFAFDIRTTKAEESREAKRQTILTLTQIFDMFTDRILQMQQMMMSGQIPPEMGQTILDFMVKRYDLMKDTFDLMGDGEDSEKRIPYYEDMSLMVEMIETMKRQQTDQARTQFNEQKRSQAAQGASPSPVGIEGPAGPPVVDQAAGGTGAPADTGGTPAAAAGPPNAG